MATQDTSVHYTGTVELGSKWSVWQTCRVVVGGASECGLGPEKGLNSSILHEGGGYPAQTNGATEENDMSQGCCKKFCAGCCAEHTHRMYKPAPSSTAVWQSLPQCRL